MNVFANFTVVGVPDIARIDRVTDGDPERRLQLAERLAELERRLPAPVRWTSSR